MLTQRMAMKVGDGLGQGAERREPMVKMTGDRNLLRPIHRASFVAGVLFGGLCWLTPFGSVAAQTQSQTRDAVLSPFEIGGDYHTSQDLTTWIPQMSAVGIQFMRACDSSKLQYVADHHMECGGILYAIPPGDTKDAPGTLPVKDLPAWSAYVTDQVRGAQGKIKYWEVWNEPPNGTGPDQTAADYAKIVIAAYDAAKAVDPRCKIGMAAQSVNVNYLEQAIKAGAKDHFDYITLHPYETLGSVEDNTGTEAIYMNIAATVRKMLAAQDPAKADVTIWFTEIGYDASNKYDASRNAGRQAEAVVKAYSMGIAQGISVINWFEGIDGDSGPMGLLEANGTPRPAYTAMAQMIQHLGSNPVYLGWVLLNHKDYGFVFRGAKTTVLASWAPKGDPDHIKFDRSVQIVDPITGHISSAATYELTTAPILVVGVPAKLVAQAKADKLRPFPWGGDYTNAKSVSVTMGKTAIEKGLHTEAGDSVAANVIAYGGSARAGDAPGGTVFMVDPNFLTYTATPIQITAVVRRNPANDLSSLSLEYESITGYKKVALYEVPDNKEWHTATWKIDDSQFVSKWGFNFRFDPGKYYLKSVTVTKLAP